MVNTGGAILTAVLWGGAQRLREAVPNASASARRLWAAASGQPSEATLATANSAVPADCGRRFDSLVTRVTAGEPEAYVLGSCEFYGLELKVDPRVLIPRPETEGLVALAAAWGERNRVERILDLGTGSGCIAIALSKALPDASVVATDDSAEALGVAAENAAGQGCDIDFRLGPYFEPVADMCFDLVVSNPPYVSPAEYRQLDVSVRDYEPAAALVSPADGMEHLNHIIGDAAAFLRCAPHRGGLLALEVDCRRADAALRFARTNSLLERAVIHRDVFGRERFLTAVRAAS